MAIQRSEIIDGKEIPLTGSRQVKRYASIDFLRGGAIVGMIVLHIISDTLDVDGYIARINDIAIINILALIILPFIGGLAGLFLMTSAVANMIGMTRNIEKGHSPNAVIQKQVFGGFLVIIFAMLSEGVIGYHGSLGNLFHNLHDLSLVQWDVALFRTYHFETLHTIGWAIVLNGITQGILVKIYDLETERWKMVRVYWLLALGVVLLTPLFWFLTAYFIPGYPFEINPATGQPMYMPYIGRSPWYDFILYFFINPLAAPLEPIFPYLATSYVGSIVGLHVAKPPKDVDKTFLRKYFTIGLFFFAVGFAGVVLTLINVLNVSGLDVMLDKYRTISEHRDWTAEKGVPGGWLWQYSTLNGLALMLVILALRLSEYRGKGEIFAHKTTFIRRFGFIALTIYTAQFVYFVVHLLVSLAFGKAPYTRLPWIGTFIVIILSLYAFHWIMLLWEKNGYLGSLEWVISSIVNKTVGIRKQTTYNTNPEKLRWYEIGKLNVKDVFYEASWQNFYTADEDKIREEKRLIKYAIIAGFFLFPFSFLAFYLTRNMEKSHPQVNVLGLKIGSIIGIGFFMFWLPLSLVFSLSAIGIAL